MSFNKNIVVGGFAAIASIVVVFSNGEYILSGEWRFDKDERGFLKPREFDASKNCPVSWSYNLPSERTKWITHIEGGDSKIRAEKKITKVDDISYTMHMRFIHEDAESQQILSTMGTTVQAQLGLNFHLFNTLQQGDALSTVSATYSPEIRSNFSIGLGETKKFEKTITTITGLGADTKNLVDFEFRYAGCGTLPVANKNYAVSVIEVWDTAIVNGNQIPSLQTYYVSDELGIALAETSPVGSVVTLEVL